MNRRSALLGRLLLSAMTACSSQRAPDPTTPTPKPVAPRAPAPPLTFSVVSTNDVHGHLQNLPQLGGFVQNLRRARAADGGAVLLLDGGDTLQGELASNLNEGAAVIDAFNLLGYTAAAVGNHEFDFGPVGPTAAPRPGEDPRGALLARARQAHYPLLVSNLVDSTNNQPFSAPNVVPGALIEVAGVKVGLVGALTLETTQSVLASVFAGLRLAPLTESITREAERLRSQGATVVIVIAHAGGSCKQLDAPDDLTSCDSSGEIFAVARELRPGLVDAIVSGHTHTQLAHRVNGIPIIQSGEHAEALARVDLFVDPSTHRIVQSQLFLPVTLCTPTSAGGCAPTDYEGAAVVENARVRVVVDAAFQVADQRRNRELGVSLSAPFTRSSGVESPLSNLVADLMRKARPQAEIAIMHAGGLRADLPPGALHYGDLYETYPRDSTFAVATLTGAQLTAALAANFSGPSGLLASLSGARAEAKCEGGKLTVVLRRDNGRVVGPTEKVVVATNNLLAAGAKGPLGGAQWQIEDEPPIREELARILGARGGTLKPDDKALFDPARLRVKLPSKAPIACAPAAP